MIYPLQELLLHFQGVDMWYACAAICISFTLFVFITVFFLIAASHW